MQVEINREPKLAKIDNLFVLLVEGETDVRLDVDKELQKAIRKAIDDSGFRARRDEIVTLLAGSPRKITLVGLGPRQELTTRQIRRSIQTVARTARRNHDQNIAVHLPFDLDGIELEKGTRLIADLLSQSDYRYDPYITVREADKRIGIRCTLIPSSKIDAKTAKRLTKEAEAISAGVETVRDLGNAPGNEMTPREMAARAEAMAKKVGIKCTVYDKRQIEKMKMGGLLAVNRGAVEEPRLIVLEYSPKKAKRTIALVGKGITFDSGGISIKPSERMEEMKFDMCGGAAVIGILEAAARLGLPHRIIGIVPATENLPSGSAYKPGDIIRMMSGKTVEVVNTDAEGRMILADALHFAAQFEPDHLIDYATLTGACVVSLGYEATGLFSNDDDLARKLIASGERVGERLWRLPEWDDYKEYIRSDWADMKNSGGRWGGAITAAIFLKEFVKCSSWAHLDIAGTAWAENENSREPKGATGAGVRQTIDFLESLA